MDKSKIVYIQNGLKKDQNTSMEPSATAHFKPTVLTLQEVPHDTYQGGFIPSKHSI